MVKLNKTLPPEPTDAQKQAELDARIKGLNAELIPLLAKYKMGLGASAFLLPDGRVSARPQLIDDSASYEKKDKEALPEGKPKSELVEG